MPERFRRRPSFANTVSLIALFVALGGTAWALELNSVRSKHIVNEQVRAVDLGPNSVTASELAPGSVDSDSFLDLDALDAEGRVCAGSIPINGTTPPCGQDLNLGDFTVSFRCERVDPSRRALVVLRYGVVGSLWSVDSNAPNGVNNISAVSGGTDEMTLIATGPTTGANYEAGDFAAYGDQQENGERDVLTGEVAAGTNVSGHDCVFSFSALG